MADNKKILMMITSSSIEEAERIGKNLVEKRLAACCSIVPKIRSIYWWDGKVTEDAEVMLMIKSVKAAESKIIDEVKSIHSYQVPELISIDLTGGCDQYFGWIDKNVSV